mgnify:CR=1 FL=1
MNEELCELYADFLRSMHAKFPRELLEILQPPFFLSVDDAPYGYNETVLGKAAGLSLQPWTMPKAEANPFKLMIVGQETFGWQWSLKGMLENGYDYPRDAWKHPTIDTFLKASPTDNSSHEDAQTMMEATSIFCFSAYQARNHRSVFWRFTREAARAFAPRISLLYNNLVKIIPVHEPYPIVRTWKKISTAERELIGEAQSHLIRREIEITRPDLVIFTTGPHYDSILESSLKIGLENDPRFGDIAERHHAPRAPEDWRARALKSTRIPCGNHVAKGIRVYHPGYMNRHRGIWSACMEYIESLAAASGQIKC